MKVLNNICRVLALVLAVGALVLFFLSFVSITTSGGELLKVTGAQLGFGGKVTTTTLGKVDLAKSSQILFCFLLTAIAAILSAFSFKFKWTHVAAPIVALVSGIYMLVISLSNPVFFVDYRPLTIAGLSYDPVIYFTTAALLLASAFGIASIFLTNYIGVKESKGAKKTINQHIVSFLREYKSEVKKIVWPGPRSVVKNTTVVLIICLLIGAFIWLLDFGLSQLVKLILGS